MTIPYAHLIDCALAGDNASRETLLNQLSDHQRTKADTLDCVLDNLVDAALAGNGRELVVEITSRLGLARPTIAQVITDPVVIDDVEQQTLLALTRSLPSFEQRARFRTWLYRIARNEALQYVRRNRRVNGHTHLDEHVPETTTGQRAVSSMVANSALIAAAMSRLSPEHRQILELRGSDGLDYAAIAERLDLNLNTVRTRLRQARIRLAEEIALSESA